MMRRITISAKYVRVVTQGDVLMEEEDTKESQRRMTWTSCYTKISSPSHYEIGIPLSSLIPQSLF